MEINTSNVQPQAGIGVNEQSHTQTNAVAQAAVNQYVPSREEVQAYANPGGTTTVAPTPAAAPAATYIPGPDQVQADYRRQLEAANSETEALKAQLANPEVARFLEFQQAQKAASAAEANGTSPEVMAKLTSLEASQTALFEARELESAQNNFNSFTTNNGMDAAVQEEFIGYMDQVLPQELQDLALKPGFNFEPYMHGFAAQRGASATQAQQAQARSVTYVPGQPAGNSSTQMEEVNAYIQNIVKRP